MKKMSVWIGNTWRLFRAVADRLRRDCVSAFAGQTSFFVVISAIPFLILLFSALKAAIPSDLSAVYAELSGYLPEVMQPLVDVVFAEAVREADTSVLSLTGLTLLWAASRGTRSLCEGVRSIYGTRERVKAIGRYIGSVLTTLLLLLTATASAIFLLFQDRLADFLYALSPILSDLFYALRFLILLSMLTLVFALFYAISAHSGMPLRSHLTGALFSSLCFALFSAAYAYYVNHIADVSHLYGGLSAVILLILWVYVCMSILLIGAEINVWLSLPFASLQTKPETSFKIDS